MKRTLLLIVVVVVLALGSMAGWAAMDFHRFVHQPLSTPTRLEIGKGWFVTRIADGLERQGVVTSARWFEILARFEKFRYGRDIQAGEYDFAQGDTPRTVLDRLTKGSVVTHRLVIPEGMTVAEIGVRMKGLGWHTVDALLADPEITQKLALEQSFLEGWLFPSTYHYQRGDTALEMLRRMVQQTRQVMDKQWAIHRASVRSSHVVRLSRAEVLVLASVIEKETGKKEERGHISSVFHNRLRRKMRLQSDPTVIYGVLNSPAAPAYRGNLTRKHLRTPTPYNTYTQFGLPPTPICNPGGAAIQAAIQPDNTKDLFFVARGDGSHAFSRTLKAHEAYVDRYQRRPSRKKKRSKQTP